jgi:hypothetical protein
MRCPRQRSFGPRNDDCSALWFLRNILREFFMGHKVGARLISSLAAAQEIPAFGRVEKRRSKQAALADRTQSASREWANEREQSVDWLHRHSMDRWPMSI